MNPEARAVGAKIGFCDDCFLSQSCLVLVMTVGGKRPGQVGSRSGGFGCQSFEDQVGDVIAVVRVSGDGDCAASAIQDERPSAPGGRPTTTRLSKAAPLPSQMLHRSMVCALCIMGRMHLRCNQPDWVVRVVEARAHVEVLAVQKEPFVEPADLSEGSARNSMNMPATWLTVVARTIGCDGGAGVIRGVRVVRA